MTRVAPDLPDAVEVAAELSGRLGKDAPALAIVLGSGLGALGDRIESAREVRYTEVPGLAHPSVEGHPGRLIAGTLAGRRVIALAGRLHMYEGHTAAAVAWPMRLVKALGAPAVLLSNAAGAIRRTFRPGDLMLINDHINLGWRNPLVGRALAGDQRFPDMSSPYDQGMRELLHHSASALGMVLHDGVYAGLTGPSYETPAEVRMLERLGADAVGMSTVPEVITARAIGLRVAAVSCISNSAAGISQARVDHADVLRVAATVASRFEALLEEFVRRMEISGVSDPIDFH